MNHGGGRAIGDEPGSIRAELDAEADRQMKKIESDIERLEREIDEASEGTLGEAFAQFVAGLGTEEGARRALLDEMMPEERAEARRRYLEYKSGIAGVPPTVLDAVYQLEAALARFPSRVRRRALAHALWRSLASMNESAELWTESVTLRDGGRKVTFELSALWEKEE